MSPLALSPSNASADRARTLALDVAGVSIAYRRLGPDAGVPLVLLQRLRGTLDHWDPLLLDALAAQRPVYLFDSIGVGRTDGTAPASIGAMAEIAADFVQAVSPGPVDVLGWSMGGAVAQALALHSPGLVRRLVLAATGPGGTPDAPAAPARVWEVASRPVNDDEDFLYLFFPETEAAVTAGRAHLARLGRRVEPFGPQVHADSVRAQLMALGAWSRGVDSAFARLHELRQPVFVANGVDDVMVHAYHSYVLSQKLPDACLHLYPGAGHGFLFQHAEAFARHMHEFLD